MQYSCIFQGMPQEVTCIFLAESYNPHFFAFFSGFVPAVLLVCFTCLTPCSVSVSSVCFLLHPHILCFPLLFLAALAPPCCNVASQGWFQSIPFPTAPQHAVNGASADRGFLIVEGRRQHQHLLVAHVFEAAACTETTHKYLPDSVWDVSAVKLVALLFLKVKFQVEEADGTTS